MTTAVVKSHQSPTEAPILFSAPMVRAIIDGRKTETRRIARPGRKCPYDRDRLWVRETWGVHWRQAGIKPSALSDDLHVWYREDWGDFPAKHLARWQPGIFMPRWASRITLITVTVREEPLQAMTCDDAEAEGFASLSEFIELWDRINAKRGPWESNPLVWVVSWKEAEVSR